MIRPVRQDDCQAVIELWQECGLTRPWNDPKTDFRLALENATSTVLGYWQGSKIIGSAMTGFDGHRGWIYYLCVLPEFQKRGVAKQLLDACEGWLAKLGCPKVELMVRSDNPTVGLYDHLGWEIQSVTVYGRRISKKDK